MSILELMKFLQIRLRLLYRFNSNYRQIIDTTINMCEMLAGDWEKNVWGGIPIVFNKLVPGFVHSCPYQNEDLQIRNVSLPKEFRLSNAPAGDYKINVLIFNKQDEKIANGIVSMHIKSDDVKEF